MPSASGTWLLNANGERIANTAGTSRVSNGTSDPCDCECEEGEAPCECPCSVAGWQDLANSVTEECSGLMPRYRFVEYTNGDIGASACEDCDAAGDIPLWDGSFPFIYETSRCMWAAVQFGADRKIDGKALTVAAETSPGGRSRLYLDPELCAWVVELACDDGTSEGNLLWRAINSETLLPPGTFTRDPLDPGCADGPDSLELEEF